MGRTSQTQQPNRPSRNFAKKSTGRPQSSAFLHRQVGGGGPTSPQRNRAERASSSPSFINRDDDLSISSRDRRRMREVHRNSRLRIRAPERARNTTGADDDQRTPRVRRRRERYR
jgi:hypothetical protein